MLKSNIKDVKNTLQETSFPQDIIVEASGYCNLRCTMCPYPTLKRPKGEMEFEVFQKIVDEVAAENPSSRLWLAIMGEPLIMGERVIRMMKYAKDKGLAEVILNTNATFMTPDIIPRLIDSGLDKIILSLDAITAETYDRVRVGGDFSKVMGNIHAFLSIKADRKATKPELIAQFIVMDENEHEVELFKEYWLAKGVIVKIRPKLGWGHGVKAENLEVMREEVTRDFACAWLTRTVSIHWDGTFAQCDADHEGIYSPGDLKTQTIKKVWDGELAKRRQRHWELDFDFEPCRDCNDWLAGRSYFFHPEGQAGTGEKA